LQLVFKIVIHYRPQYGMEELLLVTHDVNSIASSLLEAVAIKKVRTDCEQESLSILNLYIIWLGAYFEKKQ